MSFRPDTGEYPPSATVLQCVDCRKVATLIEAKYRLWRNGRCGYCGGFLR